MMLMPQMYRMTRTNYLNKLGCFTASFTTMRGNPCRRAESAGYGRCRLTLPFVPIHPKSRDMIVRAD